MATSPHQLFRFLAENTDLVLVVFERGEVDEAELLALIERHRSDSSPAATHLRAQFEDLGIIERAAQADAVFEITQPVADLLAWLTRRQRLASATVLRAYLSDIGQSERELGEAILSGEPSAAAVGLRDLDSLVERVRTLSDGNREAVVSEAQGLRAASKGVSAVERFTLVERLWERHLTPLRQLVRVQGEMEHLLDRLRSTLDQGEDRFITHGPVQRGFSRALARLARMRRAAFDDHHAAIMEIEPLYRRVQRDSRWLRGASRALARIRIEGASSLNLDERLGLVGWRTRYLMSDEKIRARMAALVGYTPAAPTPIAAPAPPPELPLITREELERSVGVSIPIPDLLAFVLATWPDLSLSAQLRAFGELLGGTYGAVTPREPAVAERYRTRELEIEAVPISLNEPSGASKEAP